MKTKGSLVILIVAGFACLGAHTPAFAQQAADGSSSGKNRAALVLSTQAIGIASSAPRDAKAGSVTLVSSPPPTDIQNAGQTAIYVTAGWGTGGWSGGGASACPQWNNGAVIPGRTGGTNRQVGNVRPTTSSNLRVDGVSTGQLGTVWNAQSGNLAAVNSGWSAAGGMSGQNLDRSSFGAQPVFGAGRMGSAPRR
ncbi:hypothetical protein EGT07_11145 [Herbaspirillum sp. HC18]|nr:hypothetical protein EGT07_11145 [Herbaspirillum sp. HC18]